MKKLLSIIAGAMLLCFTGCSEEECDHNNFTPSSNDEVVGTWYEEDQNEEIRLLSNGTFYDRFANFVRCNNTEGQWEYDSKNKKLTYRYSFLGQTQFTDWTVKNLTDYGFTISSDKIADLVLEKVVESYDMKVGDIKAIQFRKEDSNFTVTSYSSSNVRVASVASDGTITAEGEKGVAYIKVSSGRTNVWVKVTVGDNCAELWADYVSLIGMDYNSVRNALHLLGEPVQNGEDGYSYQFVQQLHDVIELTNVFLCPQCRSVDEIHLVIKESVTEAEILAYMDSRYYKVGDSDNYVIYSTEKDANTSKAIVAYNKGQKAIIICETSHFYGEAHLVDLWTDFVPLFKKNQDGIKSAMATYDYPFLLTDYSYSVNGSDYYSIKGSEYATMVGFVFNPDNQMSEYWVYLDASSNPNEVYEYLGKKYIEAESEETDYTIVFYNEDRSIKVVFDLKNVAVVYTNQTMKQHAANPDILGNYYESIGLNHDQIIAKYGVPYQDKDDMMFYLVGSDYVSMAAMRINSATSLCDVVSLIISENASDDEIVNYLSSKYNVFANGTSADGSQYAWTDGPTVAESTMGIIYKPGDKLIQYLSFDSTIHAEAMVAPSNDESSDASLAKGKHLLKERAALTTEWMRALKK